MIVVDVEASGVDPYKHSLLSIGAVDFENPVERFYEECRIWDGAGVMDESLAVNGYTPEQINDPKKQTDEELVKHFLDWALRRPERTIAGENPSFDRDFIRRTAERYHMDWPLAHRTIDLHSVCYFHMVRRGIALPVSNGRSDLNSEKIEVYVGIPVEPKPHIAINGAVYEAEALCRLMYDKPLFEEFKQFKIPWL